MLDQTISASSVRARVRRIIADWRDRPEISASMLAAEYATRHGPDDRTRAIASDVLRQKWGLMMELLETMKDS
jgi:hypothetical protein